MVPVEASLPLSLSFSLSIFLFLSSPPLSSFVSALLNYFISYLCRFHLKALYHCSLFLSHPSFEQINPTSPLVCPLPAFFLFLPSFLSPSLSLTPSSLPDLSLGITYLHFCLLSLPCPHSSLGPLKGVTFKVTGVFLPRLVAMATASQTKSDSFTVPSCLSFPTPCAWESGLGVVGMEIKPGRGCPFSVASQARVGTPLFLSFPICEVLQHLSPDSDKDGESFSCMDIEMKWLFPLTQYMVIIGNIPLYKYTK